MTLAAPAGLYLLLLIPLVVLLHLFRRERRRRTVSSILLWQDIRDQSSRRLTPRLLRNLNLLLQVLAIVAAAVVVGEPFLSSAAVRGPGRLVLVVDRSASMGVSEGSLTRLDLAKNRARERISASRRDTEMMIVSMGEYPRIEQPFTTDQTRLLEALRSLGATDERAAVSRTLEFAVGMGAGGPETGIALFTDGAFDPAAEGAAIDPTLADTVLPALELFRVGSAQPNVAITRFELRRTASGVELFVETTNYDRQPRSLTLRVRRDEQVVYSEELTLAGGETRPQAANLPGSGGTLIVATLAGADDALSADDQAVAVLNQAAPVQVQLVTEGNFFLRTALEVLPEVTVTEVPAYDAGIPADVVVFDTVPAPALDSGSILVVNTALEDGPFTPRDTVDSRGGITVRSSEITAGVQLDAVEVLTVLGGRLAQGVRVHATRAGLPVLYTYQTETLRLAGLNLSTRETDLALSPGFPVLVSNIISWLSPTRSSNLIRSYRAGEAIELFLPLGTAATVEDPDGAVSQILVSGVPALLRATSRTGVYTVRAPNKTIIAAVNLVDPDESNLEPRFSVSQAPREQHEDAGDAVGRELWPFFLTLLLALLVADWFVWVRRT